MDELLADVARYKKPRLAGKESPADPVGFVIPLADWQIGKGDGDGVKGTTHRIMTALEMVEDYYAELKRLKVPIDCLYLMGMGDMIEQCSGNYASQQFTVELNHREQMRLARRLLRDWVIRLSRLAPKMVVGGVGGNHGEHRATVGGKAQSFTTPGDNDDVALFEMVAEVLLQNDDAFGHVNFVIPEERLAIVLDICGTIVGFHHGHSASRGSDPQAKFKNWLKDMSFSNRPIGDAKIVVSGHYHHLQVVDHGPKTWIQCPAMDGGSIWWEERTGSRSTPGTVAFCVGKQYPMGFDRLRLLGFDSAIEQG